MIANRMQINSASSAAAAKGFKINAIANDHCSFVMVQV